MYWLILAAAVADPTVAATTAPSSAPVPAPIAGQPCPGPGCDYDKPPQILHKTKPDYPTDALLAGVQGQVMLQAQVSETGEPTDISVVDSVPMLDAAAIACMREWRFAPAQKDGKPVAAVVQAMVTFRIPSLEGRRRTSSV